MQSSKPAYSDFEHSLLQAHASPEDLITSRIQTLTPAQRSMFLNLSYVMPGVDISTVRLTERTFSLAIFQTNAIAAGSDVGIFPKVARLNHGCSAAFNAVYSWRDKAGQLVVHAIKHIHAGEVHLSLTYQLEKILIHHRKS